MQSRMEFPAQKKPFQSEPERVPSPHREGPCLKEPGCALVRIVQTKKKAKPRGGPLIASKIPNYLFKISQVQKLKS